MLSKMFSNLFMGFLFTAFSIQIACADGGIEEQSFPFDKACFKYDKSTFKVGQSLLDVISGEDFPQYCVLYSLSGYQVKQKGDGGYFIIGARPGLQHVGMTRVFLKTTTVYRPDQALAGKDAGDAKPVGQWAYFIGPEQLVMENGAEQEIYVFQEIDF